MRARANVRFQDSGQESIVEHADWYGGGNATAFR
jgi:hypothetical protein